MSEFWRIIFFVVQQTMYFAIPLLVVALGGMFSERSGVVNIALEGIMVFGAFTGILFINIFQDVMEGQLLLILAILVACIAGGLISLLHAYASVNMKADQVISGTAINMLTPAVAIYVARMIQDVQQIAFNNTFRIDSVPVLGSIPYIGDLFFQRTYITTYLGFAILIVSALVLYKTRFGLRLRACGEHPHAADSVGINVYKMRYAGVSLSGILAGIGGFFYAVGVMDGNVSGHTGVAGFGFLALAVMIFGQWKPIRIMFAAMFFAFLRTLAYSVSLIPFLFDLGIDQTYYKILPYLATMIVLALTSKNSRAPKAEGIPYD